MSVTKYQIFLKTVEKGSFTAAAREMNFTQSGVSHAISSLEEELGVTLLVRSHGGVTPTADGRALTPYFEEMCALQHRLEQHAADLRGLETGLVRVATFTSVSEKWLPGMLKTFQEQYPRIEFELLPSNFNNEISDWVLHGQADCGFISLPTPAEKYLDCWLLQRDQWKVILPCDHPLAGRPSFEQMKYNEKCCRRCKYGLYDTQRGKREMGRFVPSSQLLLRREPYSRRCENGRCLVDPQGNRQTRR